MSAISDQILQAIERLEPEDDINMTLERLLESELIRRLARYELADRQFQKKYGMTFAGFTEREVVKERGYSFEVENDYWDWEMATDGLKTVRELLDGLRAA